MPMTKPVLTGLITWGAIAALLAGCNSSTPSENTDQACASADAFRTAVNDFTDTLSPGTTVDEVQAAREDVQRTFEDLMEEGGDVAEDKREALNKAVGEFQTAVDAVPDDAALLERAAVLRAEVAKIDITRDEYVAELDCG
ncbi:hypothetical protein C4K88_15240 [Arthrobacter pityocampae]|uniref:Lipoprotein n=2 Tax=Arthrobacter pityocampae TaxID=547334 RepID=A0A2S5IUR9_9MICC|nr:hypothetical protein C4K88_15240 [Arthrobacter pityocampae]